ncbi:MAG TPA: hypothetical protein VG106_08700, partial [Vicinamibacterales bacterium]|nr:hypothetical protein [Vicinamibacterales bacterium]
DAAGVVQTTFRRRDIVFWRVRVQDQFGNPVAGASVQTRVTFGVTPVATLTATTGADGTAVFSRRTHGDAIGTYIVSVGSVSNTDVAYDPSANIVSSTTYVLNK